MGLLFWGFMSGSRILSAILKLNQDERPSQTSILKLAGIFGMAAVGVHRSQLVAALHRSVWIRKSEVYLPRDSGNDGDGLSPAGRLYRAFPCDGRLFALGRSRRRDFFRPALLILTAIVPFVHARHVVCGHGSELRNRRALRERQGSNAESHAKWPTWETASYALAAIVALIVSFGYGMGHGMKTPDMINYIDRIYPVRATAFASDSHLKGPMYNNFNWGGFLIFNLRDQPVSIDGRNDLYGDDLLRRAIDTAGAVNWQNDPDLARANFVLSRPHGPFGGGAQ